MRNQVQLIAYADRFGGDLPGLGRLLDTRFPGVFGGVHILPFFTPYDRADAGFDPVDHRTVDPRLGSWDDVRALSRRYDTVVDVIVNHVSARSAAFRDVVARGDASPWAPMFLTFSTVFPWGATEDALAAIYRPRPGLPFTPMTLGGRRRLVWTTFSPQQVDIDVRSAPGRDYLLSVLDTLAAAGVSLLRLDAAGYAIKTAGTSCFLTPDTLAFLDELTGLARQRGLDVLVELHASHHRQLELAGALDVLVYDFALPPLVLHAAYTGDHDPLVRWLRARSARTVTVLDTHDGIGVIDVAPEADRPDEPGLLTTSQVEALVEGIHTATGGASRAATGAAAANLDLYQVNSTFYDALAGDDQRYLAARALQFFTPGIPQVYYVGALAGGNDLDLLAATGVGRDINRHRYTSAEIDAALSRPVVRALAALARFRNTCPAFAGTCRLGEDPQGGVRLSWRGPAAEAELAVDLHDGRASVEWVLDGRRHRTDDLLGAPPVVAST